MEPALAFTTLNVRPRYAELARKIAHARGVPVGELIEQLIEACATTTEVYVAKTVEEIDGQLRIHLGDCFLQLPLKDAEFFAEQLQRAVIGGPAIMNLDAPNPVTVARRGVGIIVDMPTPKGETVRSSMNKREAERIAEEIKAHFA